MKLAFACTALLAVPLAGQTLVISNMNHTTAQLLDVKSGAVLATLPTTSVPHEVAVSPNGKWAVVTDYGSQQAGSTLTLIDVATAKVTRTISVAPYSRPHGAVFLNDNKTLVVTAERDSLLLLVDVEAAKITGTKRTGQRLGHMVAIPRDQKLAFVANIPAGTLSIVDLVGNAEPVVVKVGTQTEGIGVTPDGRFAWLGSNNTGKVYIVDAALKQVVDSIQTGGMPYRIGFTPDGKTAVVTNPTSNEVRFYDAATRRPLAEMKLTAENGGDAGPQGIIISPDGGRVWITLGSSNEVVAIDIAGGRVQVVSRWPVAAGPDGIAYSAVTAKP